MSQSAAARKPELDVAKGLALLSVVLGHVIPLHGTFSNWIFSFHMPLFFFLTGMTFRPEKYAGFGMFLKDKWKKRIVPYFVIVFVGFVICMIRPSYREPVMNDGLQYQLLAIFYYARPMNLYVGQAWYLVALFMAELFAYSWLRLFGAEEKGGIGFGKKHPALKWWSLAAAAWIAVLIPKDISWIPVVHRLPWKIDSGLCGAVFVLAGYGAARVGLLEKSRALAWHLFPVFLCFSYFFGPRLFDHSNICECIYPEAPYYYTAAFFGIAAVMMAALILKNFRFWQFCGRYTLQMFAAQTFAIYFVTEMIARVTGTRWEPMLQMPGKAGCILITLAAFGLLVIFAFLWDICKRQFRAKA